MFFANRFINVPGLKPESSWPRTVSGAYVCTGCAAAISDVSDVETTAETFQYWNLGSKRKENVSVQLRNFYTETKTLDLVQMFLFQDKNLRIWSRCLYSIWKQER